MLWRRRSSSIVSGECAIRATAMRGIPCANVIFLLLQETLAVLVGETNGGAL